MAIERALTTSEAAAGLGVSRSTVKNWIKEFSLGAQRDARGDWRIDPNVLPIFEEVKRLRDEGLGLDSIRRVIGTPRDAAQPRPGSITRFPAEVAGEAPADGLTEESSRELLGAAIESQERLAMQLARLAHTNGQLQAQLAHAHARLQAASGAAATRQAAGEVGAAPRGAEVEGQIEALVEEREGLVKRIQEQADRLEALEAELVTKASHIQALEKELGTSRQQVAELGKALAARPRPSGMNFNMAGAPGSEAANHQLLELQKDLIKAKERIAAYEAEELDESKRPWWNFWD